MMLRIVSIILAVIIWNVNGQISITDTRRQTMNGIGASGAWWPIDLYNYPESVRNQVADLLFNHQNLGLTSYRYNIGGGGVFVGNPSRAPETFYVSPGVYNWSADPQGVFFLKKAAEYKVPLITGFVNSAPPAFTSNNRSCGGQIVDNQIPNYAQYLADVIGHWKTEGIEFTHVSPMNEPDNTFGSGDSLCGQEGMLVNATQRAAVVNALRSALDAANLKSVGIISDESSSTGNFIPEAPVWIPEAADSLAAVCHHQYGFGTNADVAEMGNLARNLSGKNTWFTEICCYAAANSSLQSDPAAPLTYSQGYEPTMIGALQLGSLLYQSFTETLDIHFDWWTALSNGIGCEPLFNNTCVESANSEGWNDGLLYYDPDYSTNENFNVYPVKRFYLLKHFAQFVGIGDTRVDVQNAPANILSLAFADHGSTGLILMNMAETAQQVEIDEKPGPLEEIWQTSPSADFESLEIGNTSFSLPGLSITTFVFKIT